MGKAGKVEAVGTVTDVVMATGAWLWGWVRMGGGMGVVGGAIDELRGYPGADGWL